MPSPPALKELQLGLRDVFTDPRGARAASAARPRTLSWIREGGPCEPAARLSVYGDGYFLRLLEALAFDFPAVRRAAGEDGFRVLTARYLPVHPSTSPSLADLGERFADFIAGHGLAKRLPFLPDLARLERAVSECLLVDRRPPVAPAKLARLSSAEGERVRLLLDPTARLLETAWPVAGYWRARAKAPRRAGAEHILVARRDGGVGVDVLSPAEWRTLNRLQDGAALAPALAGVKAPAGEVQRWFSRWVAGGLISDVAFG